jgi:hypothetical protein
MTTDAGVKVNDKAEFAICVFWERGHVFVPFVFVLLRNP